MKKASKIDAHYDLIPDSVVADLLSKINGTPANGTPLIFHSSIHLNPISYLSYSKVLPLKE